MPEAKENNLQNELNDFMDLKGGIEDESVQTEEIIETTSEDEGTTKTEESEGEKPGVEVSESDSNSDDSANADTKDPVTNDFRDELIQQNKLLQSLVQTLMAEKNKKEEPVKETKKELFEEDSFKDFAEELGLDEVGSKKFAAFMALFENRVTESAVDKALQATPETVSKTLQTKETAAKMRDKFYGDHPVLSEFKPMVAQAANMLAAEDPSETYEVILKKAAERCYKALGIDPKVIKDKVSQMKGDEAGKGKAPAFATDSGSRKPAKSKSQLEQELEEMLALD